MKAIVKQIDMNGPFAFDTYFPDDESLFGVWLSVLVGPDDQEGGHLYQILVCTPSWIEKEYLHEGAVWGRHMLIVRAFDVPRIKGEIDRYVQSCTGRDFWEIAQKVSRVGAWEFEDYQM